MDSRRITLFLEHMIGDPIGGNALSVIEMIPEIIQINNIKKMNRSKLKKLDNKDNKTVVFVKTENLVYYMKLPCWGWRWL